MKKFYWFLIFLIALAAVTFVAYYNVVKVGVTLREHSVYLEYLFYALCAFLYFALLIDPLFSILLSPQYSVAKIASGEGENYRICLRLAKNLLKNGELKEGDREELEQILKGDRGEKKDRLAKKLFLVYNNTVKKNLDEYIKEAAKNTFYFTALSQNGFLDMLIVLTNNFRLVKKMVAMCGFRPSFVRVMKIYVNIFFSSLVADGAESINLSSLFGASLGSGLKLALNSITNGTINAFFMLRTGFLAKEYLFTEEAKKKKLELRKTAMAEAASNLPHIITSVVTDPLKSLSRLLFKSGEDKKEEEGEDIIVDLNQKWVKKKPR